MVEIAAELGVGRLPPNRQLARYRAEYGHQLAGRAHPGRGSQRSTARVVSVAGVCRRVARNTHRLIRDR